MVSDEAADEFLNRVLDAGTNVINTFHDLYEQVTNRVAELP